MARLAHWSSLIALCVSLCGCAAAGARFAEEASDSMDSVTAEAALVVASMDGMSASVTPEEAANANAANAGAFWSEGCFTFLVDGASVEYTLTDCTGPLGLVGVSGQVTITYRDEGSSFGFDITTTNLTVGEASIEYSVSAEVATDVRNVTVSTTAQVTGRRGHTVGYSGTYDLRWNGSSECAGIDGSWTATVGANSYTLSVSGWQRCGRRCPVDGGSISYVGPNASIIVSYDGSSEASWTSGAGGSGTVNLFCE